MQAAVQIEGLKRNNIGDVFQALAVADHLKQDYAVLDREKLSNPHSTQPLLLFANGWYMHDYSAFPPASNIKPVYVSVHFSNCEILNRKNNREHFRKHGPIGARDLKTLIMLRAAGIPSYYSGCFTVALKRRNPNEVPEDFLIVDGIDHPLSKASTNAIERAVGMQSKRVSHDPPSQNLSFESYQRTAFKHAEELLSRYVSAKLVVTTKIHCALPCLAMGVPVIIVHPDPREERLYPAREFLPIIALENIDRVTTELANLTKKNSVISRKRFFKDFVDEAILIADNPVRSSSAFRSLRVRAKTATLIWKSMFIGFHKAGILRNRLSKILKPADV